MPGLVKAVSARIYKDSCIAYQNGIEHRAPCKHIFCPYLHPRLLGQNVQIFFFFFCLLKVVLFLIKLKGMECRAPHKHIFCTYTHPRPLGLGQKVKTFFFLLKIVTVESQIKGNRA